MKILIDECVPRPIRTFLRDHDATTVQEAGLAGYSNGRLLEAAESQFDIFITSDKNLRYQQNLSQRRLGIILLSTNDWAIISKCETQISSAVAAIQNNGFLIVALEYPFRIKNRSGLLRWMRRQVIQSIVN